MLSLVSNPDLKKRIKRIGKVRHEKDKKETNRLSQQDLVGSIENQHRLLVFQAEKNLRSMCKKDQFLDFMAALLEIVIHSKKRGFGFCHDLCLYSVDDKNCVTSILIRLGNHFFEFKEADSLELEVELSTKKSDPRIFVETVFPLPQQLRKNLYYTIDKAVAADILSILKQLCDPESAMKFLEKNMHTFNGETRHIDFTLNF